MEEKKLLNKVVIFVFFAHKKYYCSFIKLQLNHWCHMDYLMMSLLHFWALNVSVALLSMQSQKALGFHQKYLNLYSEDERRSYGFGTTWGWVINDRIIIFGWTIPWTSLVFAIFDQNNISVGADSLVGSASTCSAVALRASRVRVPARGPFPIPSPLSLSNFVSCLTTVLSNKTKKINKQLNK